MFGYAGKLLRINLTNNNIKEESLLESDLKRYLGGKCFASKLLFEEIKLETDPLSPENKIMFLTGPIVGIRNIAGNSRYMVASKSPLTGIWGEGTSGGYFPVELRKTGYDFIIIEGKASTPTVLFIDNGEVKLISAQGIRTFAESRPESAITAQILRSKFLKYYRVKDRWR